MKRVIAITNRKGGVGKTTTAVNLAASLVEAGQRVLLIDLDPYGYATLFSGVNKSQLKWTCGEVLLGEIEPAEALVPVDPGGYALIGGNQALTSAEVSLSRDGQGGEFKLRQALPSLRADFDVILMDCPPSLNMLTLNALVAAESVLVPMPCDYYAMEGLASMVATLEQQKASSNPGLRIEGILRNMYDPRSNLARKVSDQLFEHFGDKVFRTSIPRNVRLAEAPAFGKPILYYDRAARGAQAYLALADEMLRRDANGGRLPPENPVREEAVPQGAAEDADEDEELD